jgi:hypothetical protein
MKASTWNKTFALAIALFAATSIPFFAVGLDFDFGGIDGLPGDFDDGLGGDFDDGLIGDFDDGLPGDFDDGFPGDFDDGFGGPVDPGDGTGNDGWDPFDDDLGPFTPPPGFPGGVDPLPDPDPGDTGCLVNCNPAPTPTPGPSGSSDTFRVFISQILIHDAFEQQPGNQVPVYLTFANDGTRRMENTKAILVIPDLQVRAAIGPVDLSVGQRVSRIVMLELPEDVAQGVYPVRLYVHNLLDKRIIHRDVEVNYS